MTAQLQYDADAILHARMQQGSKVNKEWSLIYTQKVGVK